MKLFGIDELRPAKGILYSKPHLWRLIAAGKFPRPIRLGETASDWLRTNRCLAKVQGCRARRQAGSRLSSYATPTYDETRASGGWRRASRCLSGSGWAHSIVDTNRTPQRQALSEARAKAERAWLALQRKQIEVVRPPDFVVTRR